MKIKLNFVCSRCGANSFRQSRARGFKDSILRKFGVHPQRCYICRRRFYLFKPSTLGTFLRALNAHSGDTAVPVPDPMLEAADSRWWARQDSNV